MSKSSPTAQPWRNAMEQITSMLDKLPLGKPNTFLIFLNPKTTTFQDALAYLQTHTEVKTTWEDTATIVVIATPEAIREFLNQQDLVRDLSDISLNEPTFHTC